MDVVRVQAIDHVISSSGRLIDVAIFTTILDHLIIRYISALAIIKIKRLSQIAHVQ